MPPTGLLAASPTCGIGRFSETHPADGAMYPGGVESTTTRAEKRAAEDRARQFALRRAKNDADRDLYANGMSVMEIARRVGVTRRTAVARPRIVASGCWSRGKPTWPGGERRVAARRWRLWRGLSGQRFACYVAPVRRSCALSRRIRAAAPVDTSARRWPTAPLLFPSSR